MSNIRYLEIDSTYRNREQYPSPNKFEVLISQTGIRDRFNAMDPVALSSPLTIWSPSTILKEIGPPPTGGTVIHNDANTQNRFLASFPIESSKELEGYYNGLTIVVDNTVDTVTTMITKTEFQSLNTTNRFLWLTVETPLSTIPSVGDTITSNPTFDTTNGVFWIPNSVYANKYYNDYTIWNDTQQNGAKIISYEGLTHTAGIDVASIGSTVLTAWNEDDTYVLRLEPPKEFGTLPENQTVPNLIQLPIGFSEVVACYVGSFIRITSGVHSGQIVRIITYTGPGKPANSGFPGATPPIPPNEEVPARLARINAAFEPLLTNTDRFEILGFSYENAIPFVYTGSLVSQQEMVCYEVELVNLILPNTTLVTGGRSAFYPYLYVELQNVSDASAGTNNIIYSNNPHSTKRLFRAAVDDIPNPLLSPFIKIDGDGMHQTIKFKPNDSFKFGVYLFNGKDFKTVIPETYSPLPSNELTQISALFGFRRL